MLPQSSGSQYVKVVCVVRLDPDVRERRGGEESREVVVMVGGRGGEGARGKQGCTPGCE